MHQIFKIFEGLDGLTIWQNDKILMCHMLNLRPNQTQILSLCGKPNPSKIAIF
jgi:hypothetical protein